MAVLADPVDTSTGAMQSVLARSKQARRLESELGPPSPRGYSHGSSTVDKIQSMSSMSSSWVRSRTEGSEMSAVSSPASISTKELLTEVDPEILRGISLDVALAGLGRHLQPPDSGMFNVDPKNYALSRKAAKFHAFLSHDWASSRWMKLIALLIAFNARAASVATTIASILTGLLCAFRVLPIAPWTVLLPCATFWLFILCWQRIRSAAGFPVVVFLDKLCIAQHDEALKEKGVLGLAAFLNCSDELTILWSRRYFHRLWCSYELATFMKDMDKHACIQLIPLKMGVLLTLLAQVGSIGSALFFLSLDLDGGRVHCHITTGSLIASTVILFFPLLNYIGFEFMQELEELPRQICNFRVQEAQCFCCSNQHRHPETGAEIPCDRVTVAQTLQQWFGRPGDIGEEYCRRFNRLVRNKLGPKILRSVGGDALPLSYVLYVICSSTMPWLSTVIARIAQGPARAPAGLGSLVWSLRLLLEWAQLCLALLFIMRISMLMWKKGSSMKLRRNRLLAALAMVVPDMAAGIATWWCFVLVYDSTANSSMLPGIPFILVLLLDVYLYWPPNVRVADLEQREKDTESGMMSPGASTQASASWLSSNVGPRKGHGFALKEGFYFGKDASNLEGLPTDEQDHFSI
ncbi:unnamed protein product [Symbiodinium natans]|uniref:Transmembrane protein n=1 Tax=Symbiodinium natans TaxID=878477 RepID=A0A812RY54_9DINO|nr:unnamed protein product [Symbiodinium natans]